MTTLKNLIEAEHRRMHIAGLSDATREEALGYLIWKRYRAQPWKLSHVIDWMLRYADYHREADEVERILQLRELAGCRSLVLSERRRKLWA